MALEKRQQTPWEEECRWKQQQQRQQKHGKYLTNTHMALQAASF